MPWNLPHLNGQTSTPAGCAEVAVGLVLAFRALEVVVEMEVEPTPRNHRCRGDALRPCAHLTSALSAETNRLEPESHLTSAPTEALIQRHGSGFPASGRTADPPERSSRVESAG